MKLPTAPFYVWLLRAHVEATTSWSVMLAGILLKLPAVALIRIAPAIANQSGVINFAVVAVPAVTILCCLT